MSGSMDRMRSGSDVGNPFMMVIREDGRRRLRRW